MTDHAANFRALHVKGDPFILANAWDVGSAKMLAAMGAAAIGTSSAAHAFTLGRPDLGNVTRDEALAHAQDIIAAVNVPVSGDFENGFGDTPEDCAETVRLSAEVGLAGICIEDTALPATGAYEFDLAVERIKAAADAARSAKGDFFLVARADGVMQGTYDRAEALRRLKAFEAVGADGLYAPVYGGPDDIADLVSQVSAPVNVLITALNATDTLQDYAKAGAARISLGSSLARLTHRTLFDAASAMLSQGDFSSLSGAMSGAKIDKLLLK